MVKHTRKHTVKKAYCAIVARKAARQHLWIYLDIWIYIQGSLSRVGAMKSSSTNGRLPTRVEHFSQAIVASGSLPSKSLPIGQNGCGLGFTEFTASGL